MYEDLSLYIDGEFLKGEGRKEQDVYNPATDEVVGKLPHASKADLDLALASAQKAFHSWRKSSPLERSRILRKVGELSTAKAHYAARELTKIPGVRLRFDAPFFKEFALQLPKSPERVIKRLLKDRLLAGVPLKAFDRAYKDCLLVAVTEKRTKDEIDAYAAALAAAVA